MRPTSFVVTHVPTNFVYPDEADIAFQFGSGQLVGTPLRADGDWRDYLPPEEDQLVRGIESSACYIEASQHTIATIEEEQFGEIDNNYSARFNALCSDGTPTGGNPLRGADSIRHDGLVPDSLMPFGDDLNSWNDFHSFKGTLESVVRTEGKKYLGRKILGYDVVFQKYESVATKYAKLKRALTFGPCPVSVTAWYEHDGVYYKMEDMNDNHLVELVYIDEHNQGYVRDTYAPYLKVLEPNFNFDFAMRWSVEKKDINAIELTVWQTLKKYGLVAAWLKFLEIAHNPPPEIMPTPPLTPRPETASQRLAEEAKMYLGLDASPLDRAPDELSCAECVVNIVNQAWPGTLDPTIVGTDALFTALKKSPCFKGVLDPTEGTIVVSPKTATVHGHAGVYTDIDTIASNDSRDGKFRENYTRGSWRRTFIQQRGLKGYLFAPVDSASDN